MRPIALLALLAACGRTVTYDPREPGPKPPDAGTPPFDAGLPPPDAGPPEPCMVARWPGFTWAIQEALTVTCFGKTFDTNGATGEYAFANIPAEDSRYWVPAPWTDIDNKHKSRMCPTDGGSEQACGGCRAGGDFTYYQTTVELPSKATTFIVSITKVDDGVEVMLFNSKFPNGKVGGFAFLGGGATADFAADTVAGHNRIVLVHVDDCCQDSFLQHAKIVSDGMPLELCP